MLFILKVFVFHNFILDESSIVAGDFNPPHMLFFSKHHLLTIVIVLPHHDGLEKITKREYFLAVDR